MIALQHWAFDPFIILALAVGLLHERGLRRLNANAPAERADRRRRQSLLFYGGLAVLVLAVASPIDYWSDQYLWMHMVQHLLLLFAAPALVVAGAPWLPLQHGIPGRLRRPVTRSLLLDRWSSPLRALGRFLRHPVTSVVALNAVVLFWHLPGPFDLAEENPLIHVWGMHASFFAAGVLFFLQLINSHPMKVALSPQGQMLAIFCTACMFWVLAMAMVVFSKGAWYSWYKVHEGPLLTPYADQQIGGGIMWICGDFWALPAMTKAVRRLFDGRPAAEVLGQLDRLRPGARGIRVPGRVHAQLALREAALEHGGFGGLAGQGSQPADEAAQGGREEAASS